MGDHLIVLHSAVRGCPGYDRHETPSMLMEGFSIAQDTEHGRAVTAQLTRRHGTLEEAIEAGIFGLSAADIPRGIRRTARTACEDYFYNRLGLAPSYEPPPLRTLKPSLESLSDRMQRVLEDLMELVVAGDYEELRELSGDRLEIEDLRRRFEDEVPEALVMPPPEVYRVEAVTKPEDPEDEGWAFFLDLWTEHGLSRLHLEGRLEESGDGGIELTLDDVIP